MVTPPLPSQPASSAAGFSLAAPAVAVRRYWQSSSFTMALLFTLLLGLAALLLGYLLYDFSRTNFIRETEAAIDSEMRHLLTLAHGQPQAAFIQQLQEQQTPDNPTLYAYQNLQGHLLAGRKEAIPTTPDRLREGILRYPVQRMGHTRQVAAKIHTFADGSRLLVARDIDDIVQSYERLKLFSALMVFFMLLVVVTSFFLSRYVVNRINRIAATAQQIILTGDLSRRIEMDTRWDDLSDLAQVLNAMLHRIEQLMQGVRHVANNIAHDLRTPLTRLRNHLEAATSTPLTAEEARLLLAEADHLLATFQALLRISALEQGRHQQALQPISLTELVQDVQELYEPLAEERHMHLTTEVAAHAPLSVLGDKNLLFQLLSNLLDNALKFSPPHSHIRLGVHRLQGQVRLVVSDEGAGIPEAERENVFERFYRLDSSRNTPGCGLGLSLVRAIAERHQAKILLEDNQPGLRVILVFPHYQ